MSHDEIAMSNHFCSNLAICDIVGEGTNTGYGPLVSLSSQTLYVNLLT